MPTQYSMEPCSDQTLDAERPIPGLKERLEELAELPELTEPLLSTPKTEPPKAAKEPTHLRVPPTKRDHALVRLQAVIYALFAEFEEVHGVAVNRVTTTRRATDSHGLGSSDMTSYPYNRAPAGLLESVVVELYDGELVSPDLEQVATEDEKTAISIVETARRLAEKQGHDQGGV